jgi:putative toxin-antitoxin system antitoxin component (TIGR02293 family)
MSMGALNQPAASSAVRRAAASAVVPSENRPPRLVIVSTLGVKGTDTSALIDAVDAGISWKAVRRFLERTGMTQSLLAQYLNVPERTFARRREAGVFDARESEQLVRLAELLEATTQLFDGDSGATLEWFTSPVRGLGNKRPIDLAQSEFGAREVRDLIGRLSDGVFS